MMYVWNRLYRGRASLGLRQPHLSGHAPEDGGGRHPMAGGRGIAGIIWWLIALIDTFASQNSDCGYRILLYRR